jgi:hypothetical protein
MVDEALRLRLMRREEMRSVAARAGSVSTHSSAMDSPTALERWHWVARSWTFARKAMALALGAGAARPSWKAAASVDGAGRNSVLGGADGGADGRWGGLRAAQMGSEGAGGGMARGGLMSLAWRNRPAREEESDGDEEGKRRVDDEMMR